MTTNNGFATRDDFLAFNRRRFKEVPSTFLGKSVRIRSITAAEWGELDAKNIDFRRGGLSAQGVRSSDLRLIIATVCDGNGEPVFMEHDLPALQGLDSALTQPLVKEIKDFCGLRSDVEDAQKNLNTIADSSSPYSSAEPSPTT